MFKLNLYMSLSVTKVSYFMANKEFQTNSFYDFFASQIPFDMYDSV